MTISDLAKDYGVSQQAVYQRLKRRGVKLKDLQQENSQELTEEGEKIVRQMFTQPSDAVQQIEALTRENEQLRNKLNALEHEIELTKISHESTRESLRRADENINFLRQSLLQEQEALKRTMLVLESGQQKQTGFLARLFGRKENTK